MPDPRTIYKGVAKLPPAHRLIWRRNEAPRVDAYWDLRMYENGPADLEDVAKACSVRAKELHNVLHVLEREGFLVRTDAGWTVARPPDAIQIADIVIHCKQEISA